MAGMDQAPSLPAAASHLLEMARSAPEDEQWQAAKAEFSSAVRAEQDQSALLAVLDADDEDELPISSKTEAWERALEIGPRKPEYLRRFAEHLWFHGPQDDDRAQALEDEADELENDDPGPDNA
jgi:hypothetical protein